MAKKNKSKKSKKNGKKTTTKTAKPVLTKEESIKKSIDEHDKLIQTMWNFIITPSLTFDQKLREKLHKNKCKESNVKYTPKSSIPFDRFKLIIETMTDNHSINKILDIFEWFDINGTGTISYNQFQQRMGQFFIEENVLKKPKNDKENKKKKTAKKSKAKKSKKKKSKK